MKKKNPLKKLTTGQLVKRIKNKNQFNKLNSLETSKLVESIKKDSESITLENVLDFAKSIDSVLIPVCNLPKSYSPYLFGWKGRYVLQHRNDRSFYQFQYSCLVRVFFHWRGVLFGF